MWIIVPADTPPEYVSISEYCVEFVLGPCAMPALPTASKVPPEMANEPE